MRNRFDRQLAQLNEMLIHMGSMCEDAISQTALALQSRKDEAGTGSESEISARIIEKIHQTESEIDQMEKDIESLCLKLLLQQQPVASDLRVISAALKMISDMERIGDQCADISDIVTFLNSEHTRDFQSSLDIQEMASATMKMVTKAVDSFVNSNVVLAEGVVKSDDYVDDLFMKVKTEIIKLISKNPDRGEALLDLLMIAKYFERIGDHATNVAEWVVFSITGVHKDGNTGGGPGGRTAPLGED